MLELTEEYHFMDINFEEEGECDYYQETFDD